jgi:hypothetical protein
MIIMLFFNANNIFKEHAQSVKAVQLITLIVPIPQSQTHSPMHCIIYHGYTLRSARRLTHCDPVVQTGTSVFGTERPFDQRRLCVASTRRLAVISNGQTEIAETVSLHAPDT